MMNKGRARYMYVYMYVYMYMYLWRNEVVTGLCQVGHDLCHLYMKREKNHNILYAKSTWKIHSNNCIILALHESNCKCIHICTCIYVHVYMYMYICT